MVATKEVLNSQNVNGIENVILLIAKFTFAFSKYPKQMRSSY